MTDLEKAAAMFRTREKHWRVIEEQGGNDFHTAEVAYSRAVEAMVCAEIIDEMIRVGKNKNVPEESGG